MNYDDCDCAETRTNATCDICEPPKSKSQLRREEIIKMHAHNDKGSGIICDCPKPMIEIKIPMTHDELLETIEASYNRTDDDAGRMKSALRAVVELHKPETDYNERIVCGFCKTLCHSRSGSGCDYEGDALYPCSTIQAIEKEIK